MGSQTFGIATFLFDYVCCNRIVWGATQFRQIKFRHSAGAPDRWLEDVIPAIVNYQHGSTNPIEDAIRNAQAHKIDKVREFLEKRFSSKLSADLMRLHQDEEDRPIETLWDATTAITAYARTIPFQDERVAMEKIGGDILDLVN